MSDIPAARVFKVRYGPEKPAYNQKWPNNLNLAGSGVVEITADVVKVSDATNVVGEDQRTFRLADVANVGFGAQEHLIALRTSTDAREVVMWMESAEDARALLELLPRTTTPEFQAREQHQRLFYENLQVLAPKVRVTPTLIGLNVLVFVLMLAAGAGLMQGDSQVALRFGANYGPQTWSGEYWRLITSAFIHFGLIHLAFNMYALYNGGSWTERLYGSTRFAVIYLLSALGGSVLSGWWDASRLSAGASGAVFGVFGALMAFLLRRRGDIPIEVFKSVRSGALSLIVYSLAMGAMVPNVDNAAHLGGLVVGAVSGWLLARPFEPAARARAQPAWVAAVAIVLCAALAALSAPLWMPSSQRGQEIRLNARVETILDRQNQLIDQYLALVRAVENGKLDKAKAAARMRTEIVPPWDETTRALLAIPPVEPKDSAAAKWLAALQEYSRARRVAISKTALAYQTRSPIILAQADEAWQQVIQMMATVEALESKKP